MICKENGVSITSWFWVKAGNVNNTAEYTERNVFGGESGDCEFISQHLDHKGCLGHLKIPNIKSPWCLAGRLDR